MYRTPSARRRKNKTDRLNLIPILDSVFIFIFFLLMSANFLKVFEIGSDIPIVSSAPPPKEDKKPLALTLIINSNNLTLMTGVPSRVVKTFGKIDNDKYDSRSLHEYLISIKKNNVSEETIIFEPKIDIKYEELIEIMDAVRMLHKTDEAIYKKTKDGLDERVRTLFNNIVFGNLMS